MNRIILLIILSFTSFARLEAKDLKVFFSHSVFQQANDTAYLETHLKVSAPTLNYRADKTGKYQASVLVSIRVLKNDSAFVDYRYLLNTPMLTDSMHTDFNLLDLQRYPLPDGAYNIELNIKDQNNHANKAALSATVMISATKKLMCFSDIILMDTIKPSETKNMFSRQEKDLMPMVLNMFPLYKKQLPFYVELYHAPLIFGEKDLSLVISINDAKGVLIPGFTKKRTKPTEDRMAILDGFMIEGLKEGAYILKVEVKNESGVTLIEKQVGFLRTKTGRIDNLSLQSQYLKLNTISAKEAAGFIDFLSPIAGKEEMETLNDLAKKKDSIGLLKNFAAFWTNQNKSNPDSFFASYQAALVVVEHNFNSRLIKGYRTDRGRIFLKYGRPDNISPFYDEPNAYPYEIWQYFHAGTQNNVRLIFYSPTQMSGDFTLIHTELNGEPKNPEWRHAIYKRSEYNSILSEPNRIRNYGDGVEMRLGE